MLYIILEKDLANDRVTVHSVYDNKDLAFETVVDLNDKNEGYGYMLDAVECNE